jgi:hypothetical protein
MMGLSDKHIAATDAIPDTAVHLEGHLKGDGGYILDREPACIVYLRLVVTDAPLANNRDWPTTALRQAFAISEAQIARDPRFRRGYHVVSVPERVRAYGDVRCCQARGDDRVGLGRARLKKLPARSNRSPVGPREERVLCCFRSLRSLSLDDDLALA